MSEQDRREAEQRRYDVLYGANERLRAEVGRLAAEVERLKGELATERAAWLASVRGAAMAGRQAPF